MLKHDTHVFRCFSSKRLFAMDKGKGSLAWNAFVMQIVEKQVADRTTCQVRAIVLSWFHV